MAENTKIEWAQHTFNPWIGCTKVSPACDHCYAEADFDKRRHVVTWGAGQPRKHTAPSTWAMPLKWNAEAERLGVRYRVFCASLADVFDNEVPGQWRIELMSLILATPHLDWLLLTKRIGNAAGMLETAFRAVHHGREGWAENVPPNVWIGASITSQAEADRDIPKLLQVPAEKRFLSMEPLLGPVDLNRIHESGMMEGGGSWDSWESCLTGRRFDIWSDGETTGWPKVDWVIVGGESGPNARPMHPDWARSLRDQCQAACVPFFFKQWGEYTAHDVDPEGYAANLNCIDREGRECSLSRGDGEGWWFLPPYPGRGTWGPDGIPDGVVEVRRPGKKAAGRLLDGREWNEVPAA